MRTEQPYDASSIRILNPEEYSNKFFWAKAGDLAIKYNMPEPWIRRGLDACERGNVPHDYFINRYLLNDKSIPHNQTVDLIFLEVLKENKRR
jgi:hypothetical protein